MAGSGTPSGDDSILQEGRNCWRIARAARATLLVDAARYYAVLRRVAADARRSLVIIGWDIDSRIALVPPDEVDDGLPVLLGDFLDALIERRKGLTVRVLDWDFTTLYGQRREFVPIYTHGLRPRRRLKFQFDARHPAGVAHHQKIVVVDDAIAFVGGIDLTSHRWDTPDHASDDARRQTPEGDTYPPFHDVQMMVDGECAAAVGEIARRRWRRATGRTIPAVPPAERARWPDAIKPVFRDIDIAIARTEIAGGEAVHEVEALFVDSIAAARRAIYVESPYFTSAAVATAVARRLAEPDGPEVVVVSSRNGSSWLENNAVVALRARRMRELAEADRHGRLRFYYPSRAGLDLENGIALHSKVMIVDDWFLRVGSADLTNRSLAADSECDLALEATRHADREAIGGVRAALIAEHLGVGRAAVEQAFARKQSLIAAIEALRGNERTLSPLCAGAGSRVESRVPGAEAIGPLEPAEPDKLVAEILNREDRPIGRARTIGAIALAIGVAALAAAWHWGPLAKWLDFDTLQSIGEAIDRAPATPLWVLAAYVVGSIIVMPITLMVLVTAFLFGAWHGFVYAVCGSTLGAGVTFVIGRFVGRGFVRRIAGPRLNALSRRLAQSGVVTIIVLRMLPIAPFTVINLVAGASHVRIRDFLIGTACGMIPGILAITVFADRLADAVLDPTPLDFAILGALAVAMAGGAWAVRRLLSRRPAAREDRAHA